jgi:hypothetical protein
LIENPTVKEALNYAEEVITDNLEHIAFSNYLDARV